MMTIMMMMIMMMIIIIIMIKIVLNNNNNNKDSDNYTFYKFCEDGLKLVLKAHHPECTEGNSYF